MSFRDTFVVGAILRNHTLIRVSFLVENVEIIVNDAYEATENRHVEVIVSASMIESIDKNVNQNDGELNHLHCGYGFLDRSQLGHNIGT